MFFFSKEKRIRYDNMMKKDYDSYLEDIDSCRSCEHHDYWDGCDLEYPHKDSNKGCPGYKLKDKYKKAIKYIKKQKRKSEKGSVIHDKNKID